MDRIKSNRIESDQIESSFLNSLVLFLLRLRHFVNDAIDVYQIAVDRFIVGDILPVAFEASCKDDYDAIDVDRIDGNRIESNRIESNRNGNY